MNVKRSYNLLLATLALTVFGGAFFETAHNPLGIKYFSESLVVLSIMTIIFRSLSPTKLTPFEILVLLLPIILICYSALFSNRYYGQPFYYGLIEERRILYLYFYFPLSVFFQNLVKPKDAFLALQMAAILVSILAFSVQLGLISPWNEGISSQYRAGRVSIANGLLMFGLTSAVLTFRRPHIITAAIIITCMLFVSLTRQIPIASFLSIVLAILFTSLSKKYGSPVLVFFVAIFTLIVLMISISLDLSDLASITIYLDLLSSDYLQSSARYSTISYILQDWNLFGHGALSLLWNDGFSALYGGNFFLADVGVFGTLHRFGFFSIIIVYITLAIILNRITKLYKLRSEAFVTVLSWGFSFLILLPLAAPFEYRGHLLAIFFAVSNIFCARQRQT